MKAQELEKIIENAFRMVRIVSNKWVRAGYNSDFRTSVEIYENGYRVSMYNTASSPQHLDVKEVKYGKELGKYIISNHYDINDNFDYEAVRLSGQIEY